jgi:hypothetical protein
MQTYCGYDGTGAMGRVIESRQDMYRVVSFNLKNTKD